MKFGFISIRQAAGDARVAFRRFPLVLVCAAVAAVLGIIMVSGPGDDFARFRWLATCTLGLPLFVAFETTCERRGWTGSRRVTLLGAGVLVLVGFFLLSGGWTMTMLATRYVQSSVAFHLMVAFLPFTAYPARQAFWQYNRTLFLRFLLAGLYTTVLFVGFAVAILAIDKLFAVHVDAEVYGYLWVVLAFVFDSWFFLGGVPDDIDALEHRTDYPLGLKVFAQFVLIPVVTIYLLILSAYLVRVLATRIWPSGWIGWLVSSVAATGTLALLLVHPIRDREDSRWVDGYGRWFYVALLPSIGMLVVAIFQRLDQYGFTERRYFLLILAFWLAAVALYYGITASRNIRLIPVTLCILAIASIAGPWSAYSISERSQANRLSNLLTAQGLLVDGTLRRSTAEAPPEVSREISATMRYLVGSHGSTSLGRISPDLRLAAERADTTRFRGVRQDNLVTQAVLEDALGLTYVGRYSRPAYVTRYTSPWGRSVGIEDFDALVRLDFSIGRTLVPMGTDTLTVETSSKPARLTIRAGERVLAGVPLWPLVDQARIDVARPSPVGASGTGQTPPPLELNGVSEGVGYRLIVFSLNGTGRGETAEMNSGDAYLLLSYSPGR